MRFVFRGGLFLLTVILAAGIAGCQSDRVPSPDTEAYEKAASAFYTGVAALEVGENFRAEQELEIAAERAPGEPAVWANRGLLALRQGQLETAASHLDRARSLAPENSHIQFLSGLTERERGQYEQAISFLRRAVEVDSTNQVALYTLMQVIEQQGEATAAEEALQLTDRLLEQDPGNLAVLVERVRLAAKSGNETLLRETLDRLGERASDWPKAVQESFRSVEEAASTPAEAASQIAFLKNDLQRVPSYRTAARAVRPAEDQLGEVLVRPLQMSTVAPRPARADTGLVFDPDTLVADGQWDWIYQVTLAEGVPPDVMMTDGETIRIETGLGRTETMPFPGGVRSTAPEGHAVAALDANYDFRMDLAAVGPGGVRLYRQEPDSSFRDVSERAVPGDVRGEGYVGVWPADLDMDGDLDLVLAREDGAPLTLRNNGDGTFGAKSFFSNVEDVRDFVWADFDADGTPDAAMLDAGGRLHVYDNRRSRSPRFEARSLPDPVQNAKGLAVGDVAREGRLDLLTLLSDGTIQRLRVAGSGSEWETHTLVDGVAAEGARVETTRLFTGDLDNNGALDLVQATSEGANVWLRDSTGTFRSPDASIDHGVYSVADVRGEGRLDLLALSDDGVPLRLTNRGAKSYHSQRLQPRAARTQGDRRINPFGLGGEIELRAGTLYQKRLITEPNVHFGLGRRTGADVARIIWPNGTVQAEFGLVSTQTALARQRLKGSCPWVYTYDGEGMQFETDFLWRTALGLRINAQGEAQVIHSEDRIFIPGENVSERNGMYDVRITGELWESHFFDRVELVAVDHPDDTTVRIDERFHLPAPDQKIRALTDPTPVVQAWDQEGRDVTELVQETDGRYLDTFELGPFQGRAEEHFVEVDLGDDVPTDRRVWLVADGWVYPTDTSLNLAISQGDHAPPRGIALEVPDGNGGWTTVKSDLGFPAGKSKTMLIDLTDVIGPDGPERVRLRTNMEIYWDRLAWATGHADAEIKTHRLRPDSARLRDRGFSKVVQTDRRKPTVPVYDSIASTTRLWRDLVGYHTRFGDVRELIVETDDRYVIMNAGDEMVLRFEPPPAPPEGWTRDFVLVGDGWVKDGDYNTGYSKTVRPLPYHGMESYSEAPKSLEEDPAFQMHPDDWRTYHTRYVSPDHFHRALRPTGAP